MDRGREAEAFRKAPFSPPGCRTVSAAESPNMEEQADSEAERGSRAHQPQAALRGGGDRLGFCSPFEFAVFALSLGQGPADRMDHALGHV